MLPHLRRPYAWSKINPIYINAFISVKLSIKLFPIYPQNVIINAFPIRIAHKYFSLDIFDIPASKFIRHDGVNGSVSINTMLENFILLNSCIFLSNFFIFLRFYKDLLLN